MMLLASVKDVKEQNSSSLKIVEQDGKSRNFLVREMTEGYRKFEIQRPCIECGCLGSPTELVQ